MIQSTGRLAILVSLLALAVFSWRLATRQPTDTQSESLPKAGGSGPDYYVYGLDATTMTVDGQPARTLVGRELRHFAEDDRTEIVTPYLTVHQEEGPPWEIRAEHGWISADGELILLQGKVTITRASGPNNRPVTLVTRDLRVQPNQDYAETDEAVRVTSIEDQVDSVGMRAWLRAPIRLKLLSQVRGHYVPK